jgi:hypothetical protein
VARKAVDEVEEVVADVPGDPLAPAGRAQLAQRARHRLEGRDVQDVGALGRHHRVEHERLDVAGVLGGVVERHLGAVGDAEEHDLLVAGLGPDRLDVVDRVRGAVEAAPRAELIGAGRDGLGDRADRVLEGRAAQAAGAAGAALVEDDEVAVGEPGPEDRRELGRGGERGLAGAAGERDDRAGVRVARGDHALDVERERARDGAAAVDRDRQLAALEAGRLARGVGDGPLRGRRDGHDEGGRCQDGGEGPGAHESEQGTH